MIFWDFPELEEQNILGNIVPEMDLRLKWMMITGLQEINVY